MRAAGYVGVRQCTRAYPLKRVRTAVYALRNQLNACVRLYTRE